MISWCALAQGFHKNSDVSVTIQPPSSVNQESRMIKNSIYTSHSVGSGGLVIYFDLSCYYLQQQSLQITVRLFVKLRGGWSCLPRHRWWCFFPLVHHWHFFICIKWVCNYASMKGPVWVVGGVVSKRSGLVRSPITLLSWDGESGAEEDIEVDVECL